MDKQVFFDIPLKQLYGSVEDYRSRGWRLANLCASTVQDGVELLYSFVREHEVENLSVLVTEGETVPAVSPLFPSAFVFENETHDLFGVRIEDITLDYKGTFYSTSVPTPMNPGSPEALEYLEESSAAVAKEGDADKDSGGTSDARHDKAEGAEHVIEERISSEENTQAKGEEKERG